MKRFMSMLILLLLGAVPLRAQTTESYELCNANGPCFVTSGGQSCGLGTPIIRIDDLQPGSSTASYQDSLASYAKVTHVRVTIPMTKLSPFTDTPAVTLALDGQPIGPPQTVTQSPVTCSGGFATYAFEQGFPSGMPN